MLQFIVYLIFILSVAFAAGGIVISYRLRGIYKYDFLSTLMYFQVFIFTFGFYSLWGQVMISAFMKNFLSADVLVRISNITILMGLPFLVFAWLMFLKFSGEIARIGNNKWWLLWFLVFNFTLIFIFGYIITKHPEIKTITLLKYYFISFNLIYCLIASFIIFMSEKRTNNPIIKNSRTVAALIVTIMIIQNLLLFFYRSDNYVALVFIFSFFAGSSFLPLFLSYGTCFSVENALPIREITFEQFCTRFDISAREKDIITEICRGLSNQEIADKLFISLQTVKDHTHRIYNKTDVRSRVHLINLVRELRN